MVVFYTDLLNAFLPLLMVLIPAIITFSVLGTKISFVAGALIGVAVGQAGGFIPDWALVMGIILLAAILFIDEKSIGI